MSLSNCAPLQNLHSPSNQISFQLPHHPKFKPIIQKRLTNEINLHEFQLRIHLKRFSKNPKNFRIVSENPRKPHTRHVKKLFGLLKAQGSSSKLEYLLPKNPKFEIIYLFSKMRYPSLLTVLKLHATNFNFFIMARLTKNLPFMKNLNHFDLILKNLDSYDEFCFIEILSKLFYLKRMTKLSIEFVECFKDPLSHPFSTILKDMSRLTQLQSLELKFSDSNSYNIMRSLAFVIPQLFKLKRIALDFPGPDMEGSQLVKLFRTFKKLKELSDISLNLAKCELFPKTNIDSLSCALARLNRPSLLKKLRIVSYQNLTDQDLFPIAEALARFTSLDLLSFGMPFKSYEITNQGISEFGLLLESLISLSSLCLSFPFFARHAPDFGSIIKPFKILTNLELHFGGFYSPEVMPIQELTSGLKELKALTSLHIQFCQQNCLSEEGFETLAESLKELSCLKDLSLKFDSLEVFTNKKAESISNAVKKLENLSDLCLDFGVNKKIENEAVDKIAKTLQFLPNLYLVIFKFVSKEEDQGDICERLFEALKEKKKIRQVTLGLNQTWFNLQETRKLEKHRSFESFTSNLSHYSDLK